MHTHTQLHKLHQFWPFLIVALLAIVSPAQGQWYLESTIDASGLDLMLTAGNPGLGISIAIDGDTAVIGGGKDAYIFERTAGQWTQTTSVRVLPEPGTKNYFPVQVAIDGDNVAASSYTSPSSYVLHRDAPGAWSSSTLAGRGFDIDISGDTALLCYRYDWGNYGQRIFDRQADGTWAQSATLPGQVSAGFGAAGAISGNRAIVMGDTGAYVFERDAAGAWSSTATLAIPNSFYSFGKGIALSGSTALICGFPSTIYEKADNGPWASATVSRVYGGNVALDGDYACVNGAVLQRDASGSWTDSQTLLIPTGDVAMGGGKLALANVNGTIQIYSYDSSPRLFFSNFSAGSNLADLGLTTHSDSSGRVVIDTYYGRLNLTRTAAGTAGISQTLDFVNQVTFTFVCNSLQSPNSLQLTLGGVVLDTITSSGTYRRTFNLTELGLSPGQLEWNLDYTSTGNVSVSIDDLYITTNVPEPATLALLAAGALAMQRRRRR